jgi:cytochrome c553
MTRISLAKLYAVAPDRKPGYMAAVMAVAASVSETHVEIPPADFARIRSEYRKPELSLLKKAANFAASAAAHVAAGMPQASEDEVARRFAICEGCEHFDGQACRQCGCPVVREKKFLSKLSWAGESCPVGKWGPVPG